MGSEQNVQKSDTYRSTSFILIKWCLVALIVANILSSIWVGIYMTNRVNKIQSINERTYSDPNPNRILGSDFKAKAEIWKGVVITVLVITDLTCFLGFFGAIKEHYCLTMIFGLIMLMYAIFSAAVDYTRGSISSWAIPFGTGIVACLFGHKIRVEVIHPTIYSSPIND